MANNTQFIIQWVVQGTQNVVNATKQVGDSLNSMSVPVASSQAKMNNLGTALAGLTGRALLTIPVWLALRSAFMGGIRTFDDSVKSIVDMDTALKHLEMQLIGTKDAAQILSQVKINAQSLALTTGESPASLIDVYNQLVTVGFSVQDAFKGMQTAAQGALVTNTDSKDVTNTLVNVYKELGNSITAVHSPAEKLNYIMDTMTVLMQKNHLTIQDFESSLKTFAGQAAASNLTLDETLSLIAASANVSQTGQFAGRGLTGIFRQITLQRPGVEDFLGKSTSNESDWQTFQDVLQKFQSIKPTDTAGLDAISKIFSLRGGGQSLRALAEDAGHLSDNLKLLYSLTPDERQAVFAGRLSVALAMIEHQADMTKQSIEALGRQFIEGLTGTTDYAGMLAHINTYLNSLSDGAKRAGSDIKLLAEAMAAAIPIAAGLMAVQTGLGAAGARAMMGPAMAGAGLGAAGFASTMAIPFAAAGGGALASELYLNNKLQNYWSDSSAISSNQTQIQNLQNYSAWSARQKRTPTGPAQSVVQTTSTPSGPSDEDVTVQNQILDLKKQEKEVEKDLESYGYTKIQILSQELTALQNQVGTINNLKAAEEKRLELAQAYNDEVNKSAQSYMGSAEKGLTDLFMGNVKVPKGSHTGVLGAALAPFGTDIRQQQAGALSGNIVEQVFGKTGLANAFGKSTTALRGDSDPTYQGAYKGTYDGVTAAFTGKTGGSGAVAAQGATNTSSVLNQIIKGSPTSLTAAIDAFTGSSGSSTMSPMAWPGVSPMTYNPATVADYFSAQIGKGNGGNFAGGNMGSGSIPSMFSYVGGGSGAGGPLTSSARGVAATGSSPMTSINTFLQKSLGLNSTGQFNGTLPGFGKGGIMTQGIDGMPNLTGAGIIGSLAQGFGTYNSLGGKNGSMSLPSSILGTMGSIADMIPGGQVIGGAMQLIGGILGLFNTTKKVTDQVSTHQVASKLDETNQQLAMVNRNLVGMKSSIDTYIMPNSAYFATKGNLSDQFALDQQRA